MSKYSTMSTKTLVEEIGGLADIPDPDLVDELVGRGDDAVSFLNELLDRAIGNPDTELNTHVVIGLLGELRSRDTIEKLLQLLTMANEDLFEWIIVHPCF